MHQSTRIVKENKIYTGLFKIMLTLMAYFSPLRAYIDHTFPGRWTGRSGPSPWPLNSPDLTPCHFWLWSVVKGRVYSRKIRNISDLNAKNTDCSTIYSPRNVCPGFNLSAPNDIYIYVVPHS
jgi:hypothetical protein